MILKSFSLALTTSVFFLSAANSSDVFHLSDGYNGILPLEISKLIEQRKNLETALETNKSNNIELEKTQKTLRDNEEKIKLWQNKILDGFTIKESNLGTVLDQIKRWTGDLVIDGKMTPEVAKSIRKFWEEKYNYTSFAKIIFEGHKGENTDFSSIQGMQGKPPIMGKHLALVRKIQELHQEVQDLNKKIEEQPEVLKKLKICIDEKQKYIDLLKSKIVENLNKQNQNQIAFDEEKNNINEKASELNKKCQTLELNIEKLNNTSHELTLQINGKENSLSDGEKELESLIEGSEEKNNLISTIDNLNKEIETIKIEKTKIDTSKNENEKLLTPLKLDLNKLVTTEEAEKRKHDKVSNDLKLELDNINKDIIKEEETLKNIKEESEKKNTYQVDLDKRIKERDSKQEEADKYALTKYLTYLNMYLSLPNDDNNKKEEKLKVISEELNSFLFQAIEKTTEENVKKSVDRETNKIYQKGLEILTQSKETFITNTRTKFYQNFGPNLYGDYGPKQQHRSYERNGLVEVITKDISKEGNIISLNSLLSQYNEKNMEKYSYDTILDLNIEFSKESRADQIIKQIADRWKKKILPNSSFIHKIGLDSVLFNPNFDKSFYSNIFSYDFSKAEEFLNYNEKMKLSKVNIWSICEMQLSYNLFDNYTKKETTCSATPARITPIHDFIKSKIQKDSEEEEFKTFLETDKKEKTESAGQFALLNFVSYSNMSYGLRYKVDGNLSAEIKSYAPIYDLLKDNEEFQKLSEIHVTKVMETRAYVWGQHLLNECKEFVSKYGLKAFMFKE